MAIKKSELYSSIWKSCDELRGWMDASQYKDYVLVLLFMKYVSDKYAWKSDALIDIPQWWSFQDMIALKWQVDIWDKMNKIIWVLAEANDLKGVIDVADFNDEEKLWKWKDMVDRLTNLIAIFEKPWLDFKNNKAEWDDILWDAYEYLMRHFATESWKSKWQFYTPSEVSKIMAKVIWINNNARQDQTVYDPACWSWSLLLKASDESNQWLTIYGQEMDNATSALAKMNMILHWNPTAEIHKDNTLSKPFFKNENWQLKTFDFVVANPPFSTKSWSNWFNPANDEYDRFADWIPPAKNGDYAFLLHIIRSLKSTWKWAVILPHWVLFRGNAEWGIRANIIKKWYIKWIIGLPANLFYWTWIPACIIVIDKENAWNWNSIFMIDASKWFVKDWNKNRLRSQDIHKIVDVFNKQLEIPKFSRMISIEEIEKNEYNLNIPRYIDTQEEEDLQNIEAHLLWGIPNTDIDRLSKYWEVCPNLKNDLFKPNQRNWFSDLKIDEENVKNTIFDHHEFTTYIQWTNKIFDIWKQETVNILKNIWTWVHPKQIIFDISESILKSFENAKLINKYDIYQHLMTYWSDTMQDDMYIIWIDWWKAQTYRIIEKDKKWKEKDKWWTCDLVPKDLVIDRYFSNEKNNIEDLKIKLEEAISKMEEMKEEHWWEEWLLEEVINDWKISKWNIQARIKEIKSDPEYSEELEILKKYLALTDDEADIKKQIKESEEKLDKDLYAKYLVLTEEEIKTLVVDDKWIKQIESWIKWELDRISQRLTQRIKELSERYRNTLSELSKKVDTFTVEVDNHLKKMGFNL